LEPFRIFSKILGDIRELMFITSVNDTGDKLFNGVNDTGPKNLSPVSLTPVNNLYFPGVVDIVQKKNKKPKIYRRCQRHR
jgi:hypothetical protein